jgi:hypothetical protein
VRRCVTPWAIGWPSAETPMVAGSKSTPLEQGRSTPRARDESGGESARSLECAPRGCPLWHDLTRSFVFERVRDARSPVWGSPGL